MEKHQFAANYQCVSPESKIYKFVFGRLIFLYTITDMHSRILKWLRGAEFLMLKLNSLEFDDIESEDDIVYAAGSTLSYFSLPDSNSFASCRASVFSKKILFRNSKFKIIINIKFTCTQ